MSISEQRQHPRVKPPKSVVVAWQAGILRDVSYVDNLALGGMFVRTKQAVPLRSLVQILLDTPLGEVHGRGVVRRVEQNRGIGIQIIAMNPEDRARLFRQLRSLSASG